MPVEYVGRKVFPGTAIYGCARILPMPGLTSAWGFIIACGVLASRRTLYFATSPFQAICMIELFGIDFVIAGTEQLVAMVRVARRLADVRSLRTVVGGSMASNALVEAAALYLCKDVRNRYGKLRSRFDLRGSRTRILVEAGLCWPCGAGRRTGRFGPDGRACAPGEAGTLMSRIKRDVGNEPDPWVDHGDFGWIEADGAIFILGRTADVGGDPAPSLREVSPVHEVVHLFCA